MVMTPEYDTLSDVGSTGGLVRRLSKIKDSRRLILMA
jgi:hypothetical protein